MQIQVLMIARSIKMPRIGGAGSAGVSTSYPITVGPRMTWFTTTPPLRCAMPVCACRRSSSVGAENGGSTLVAISAPRTSYSDTLVKGRMRSSVCCS